MAGERWRAVGSSSPERGQEAERIAGSADASGQRVAMGPGRFARVVVRLVGLAAVVGVVVAAAGSGVTLARRADLPLSHLAPTTTPPLRSAPEIVASAADTLDQAGSFTYRGTVEADRSSLARPGIQLDGPVRVEGEVFPGIGVSHEVATHPSGRVSETMTENVVAWGRQASDIGALDAEPLSVVFETGGALLVPTGGALMPGWLSATSDPQFEAPDSGDRPRVAGTVPGTSFGTDEQGVPFPDADLVLTLGDEGEPVHVEITSRPGATRLVMSVDIGEIGGMLSIPAGADQPTSITGDVSPDEVEAAGIAHAVELGEVPDFWILYRIELRRDWPTSPCSSLLLAYGRAFPRTPPEGDLTLAVRSADCPRPGGGDLDEPVTFGFFTGAASIAGDRVFARVSDARVVIEVTTDLPIADLEDLFVSIEPFDPASRPEER